MKVDDIKPQKIVFVSPVGHGVIVQERRLPMELNVSSMIKQCKFENVPFSMPGRAAWIWLAQRAWTAKNEVCLLPKQLGEQVAKLQVRALWECEFMAHVMAQVRALDFKLWISRGITVLSRGAAICSQCDRAGFRPTTTMPTSSRMCSPLFSRSFTNTCWRSLIS